MTERVAKNKTVLKKKQATQEAKKPERGWRFPKVGHLRGPPKQKKGEVIEYVGHEKYDGAHGDAWLDTVNNCVILANDGVPRMNVNDGVFGKTFQCLQLLTPLLTPHWHYSGECMGYLRTGSRTYKSMPKFYFKPYAIWDEQNKKLGQDEMEAECRRLGLEPAKALFRTTDPKVAHAKMKELLSKNTGTSELGGEVEGYVLHPNLLKVVLPAFKEVHHSKKPKREAITPTKVLEWQGKHYNTDGRFHKALQYLATRPVSKDDEEKKEETKKKDEKPLVPQEEEEYNYRLMMYRKEKEIVETRLPDLIKRLDEDLCKERCAEICVSLRAEFSMWKKEEAKKNQLEHYAQTHDPPKKIFFAEELLKMAMQEREHRLLLSKMAATSVSADDREKKEEEEEEEGDKKEEEEEEEEEKENEEEIENDNDQDDDKEKADEREDEGEHEEEEEQEEAKEKEKEKEDEADKETEKKEEKKEKQNQRKKIKKSAENNTAQQYKAKVNNYAQIVNDPHYPVILAIPPEMTDEQLWSAFGSYIATAARTGLNEYLVRHIEQFEKELAVCSSLASA